MKQQKNLAFLLNRAQNGAILTIGPLAALNYETATIVTTMTISIRFSI